MPRYIHNEIGSQATSFLHSFIIKILTNGRFSMLSLKPGQFHFEVLTQLSAACLYFGHVHKLHHSYVSRYQTTIFNGRFSMFPFKTSQFYFEVLTQLSAACSCLVITNSYISHYQNPHTDGRFSMYPVLL